MAHQTKPISLKAARKKKQDKSEKPIAFPKPEGDDWRPDGWKHLWKLIYDEAIPFMLDYARTKQEKAA